MGLQVERVLQMMRQKKLTQRELAGMSGVTEAAMSRYLRGERQPRAEAVANMATALGVTSDYLLGCEEDKSELDRAIQLVARNSAAITDSVKRRLIYILATPDTNDKEDF